jgi:hypothetical protein
MCLRYEEALYFGTDWSCEPEFEKAISVLEKEWGSQSTTYIWALLQFVSAFLNACEEEVQFLKLREICIKILRIELQDAEISSTGLFWLKRVFDSAESHTTSCDSLGSFPDIASDHIQSLEKKLGKDKVALIDNLEPLAAYHQSKENIENLEKARLIKERILTIWINALGTEHISTANAELELAIVLHKISNSLDRQRATSLFEHSLKIITAIHGKSSSKAYNARALFADFLMAIGTNESLEDARKLLGVGIKSLWGIYYGKRIEIRSALKRSYSNLNASFHKIGEIRRAGHMKMIENKIDIYIKRTLFKFT